jgi:uncharacterized protein YegP (UPF0339 family)
VSERADYARLFQGKDGGWYVTVLAGNGEPIFQTEGHQNHADALEVVASRFPGIRVVEDDQS